MMAFDTSFLLDYLDADETTREFLADHEDKPFFAPALALFEVHRGAARTGGREQVERVANGVDWVEPLPQTRATAREAALIEAELLDTGNRIKLGDILIAGICRHNGARIVTRDDHFDRIEDLEVLTY
ncbi:VapC toxin family PIN domain ribonuclease [Halobacteriales archaeon QS_1_67_19]|nr:MAG: VapC toxin family PIN domain ribonuclease [Halobacteriales archaeon QS_1_67_19]